jgi:alpha-N-arabinofuranosidase
MKLILCTLAFMTAPLPFVAAPARGAATDSPVLVHRYSFGDGTAADSVGHADGKVVGGVRIADGQATFDGAEGERIELPADKIAINSYRKVTIEAWFTVTTLVRFQRLFDFGGTTKGLGEPGSVGRNYLFYTPSSVFFNDSRAVICPGPSRDDEVVATERTVKAGRETCVAITADDSHIALYVDGVLAEEKDVPAGSLAKLSNDFALLGASLYGDSAFDGSIREFRIYNVAATAAQVAASCKAGPEAVAIVGEEKEVGRAGAAAAGAPGTGELHIDAGAIAGMVSPVHAGLMTEEINHSYDGGLYAELIRDRAFSEGVMPKVGRLGPWVLVGDDGQGSGMALNVAGGLNENLPASLRIDAAAASPGHRVGVANGGFWGIPAKPGTKYRCSFYAKAESGGEIVLTAGIERDEGGGNDSSPLASGRVTVSGPWKRYEMELATPDDIQPTEKARFVISTEQPCAFSLALVSLFPPTWDNRPNGNRVDLMQMLADLRPKFLRFPGGNYLEGDTIASRFDWKKTLGPLADRPGHPCPWNYWSSDGMGYLEFLNWCEDLHMEPVLGIYVGLSFREPPVEAGPKLEPFVQDALDEIEYTIGDASTTWGARRAKDGHPEPFKLTYVEIGNEDGGPTYEARYAQFYDAIKAKYPQLQLIAAAEVKNRPMDVLDDHYYRGAKDYYKDVGHYDGYDRKGPKIFIGEWATVEGSPTPTFNAALGDAAWMTAMERNSDLIILQAYAPLLVNVNPGAYQWRTNLIGYDALNSFGSPSYYAQVMFNANRGDRILKTPDKAAPGVFTSATRDSKTGTIYVKIVNSNASPCSVKFDVSGANVEGSARLVTMTGDPRDVNSLKEPRKIVPAESELSGMGPSFERVFPAHSISVLVLDCGRPR